MLEVFVNNDISILSEFKIEKDYNKGHKTYICISNVDRKLCDSIKSQLRGDNPIKAFGRFDFEGSVSFNINNFYITLYNVSLSNWTYEKNSFLKLNFIPLDGFGYLSGMGLNVLREQKLNQILNF